MDNQKERTPEINDADTIERLLEAADRNFELFELKEAADKYEKALRMLSLKRENGEQTARTLSALGDCEYVKRELRAALRYYLKVFSLTDGYANPYALLRAGQVYYDMELPQKAKPYLIRAYLIEGNSLFEGEDPKYFELIKNEEMLREPVNSFMQAIKPIQDRQAEDALFAEDEKEETEDGDL